MRVADYVLVKVPSRSRENCLLFKHAGLCDFWTMKRSFSARIILAICLTMGLLMAPSGVSAMTKSGDVSPSVEMFGDMPCCPDASGHETSQNSGCKDCPLMAMCNLTIVQAFPKPEPAAGIHPALLARISAADDRFADGLIGTPPARPPRSLV